MLGIVEGIRPWPLAFGGRVGLFGPWMTIACLIAEIGRAVVVPLTMNSFGPDL